MQQYYLANREGYRSSDRPQGSSSTSSLGIEHRRWWSRNVSMGLSDLGVHGRRLWKWNRNGGPGGRAQPEFISRMEQQRPGL